jgi:hypothetical protein
MWVRMKIKCFGLIMVILLLVLGLNSVPAPEITGFQVISVTPEDSATDVAFDSVITVTFSHAVNMSTINNESFHIIPPEPGTYSYDQATFTVTFTPFDILKEGCEYMIKITGAVRDVNGESLSNEHVWQFEVLHYHHPVLIDLYCEKNSTYVESGSYSVFEISVNNTLCGSGEFLLSNSTLPVGWACWFSESNFYLSSGSIKWVSLTVTAPDDAEPGKMVKFRISGVTRDDYEEKEFTCIIRSTDTKEASEEDEESGLPGFEVVFSIMGILVLIIYTKYRYPH